MRIPYNRVHVRGDILFAARAAQIHTFRVSDGSYISAWKHPDVVEKEAAAVVAGGDGAGEEEMNSMDVDEQGKGKAGDHNMDDDDDDDGSGPPAKRQRTTAAGTEGAESAEVVSGEEAQGGGPSAEGAEEKDATATTAKRRGKKAKNRNKAAARDGAAAPEQKHSNRARVPDRPVVTHLASTASGGHVVAVTGHDKTLWVLAHDGAGGLAQLSRRAMPKRPSALQISPDGGAGGTILSADKFGDVYSVPLLPDPGWVPSAADAASVVHKPQATPLTVHSKRNLDALRAQQRQTERLLSPSSTTDKQKQQQQQQQQPAFEMTLLLGHVSMLTDLLVAERGDGRRYIVTSDRDEHIRVSRGAPQAHVIESFCLGHKDFVGAMVIPPAADDDNDAKNSDDQGRRSGDVLVSGGGDPDLFVWDWVRGRLLSRAGILPLAREIAPETTKVAVSGLYSLEAPSSSGERLRYILAICEE